MFVIVRAVTCAALFIGLVLIYVPAQLLPSSSLVRPAMIGTPQIAGMIIGGIGAVIALWCIFTFAFVGKGTSAPFDPPRRLVNRGPYRFVRNPMHIDAGLALLAPRFFMDRGRSRFMQACSFSRCICSWSRSKSRLYGELSAQNTKRIAARSVAGVRAGRAATKNAR